MSAIDLYADANRNEKLSHLKQIILLAVSDGSVHKNELASISAIMSREDLSKADLERCLKNPGSIDFVLPTDENVKAKYLRDMVLLMMSDGKIDKQELVTCQLTAEALGYNSQVVEQMVLDIVAEIKNDEQ